MAPKKWTGTSETDEPEKAKPEKAEPKPGDKTASK